MVFTFHATSGTRLNRHRQREDPSLAGWPAAPQPTAPRLPLWPDVCVTFAVP